MDKTIVKDEAKAGGGRYEELNYFFYFCEAKNHHSDLDIFYIDQLPGNRLSGAINIQETGKTLPAVSKASESACRYCAKSPPAGTFKASVLLRFSDP